MIAIERLKVEEFNLLASVDDGYTPDPCRSVAVVARNEAGIIGRIFLMAPTHVEGIFIEKAWRKGAVMKQLVEAIELEAKCEGVKKLLVYAIDEEMADYIQRLGYEKLPFTVWEKPLVQYENS